MNPLILVLLSSSTHLSLHEVLQCFLGFVTGSPRRSQFFVSLHEGSTRHGSLSTRGSGFEGFLGTVTGGTQRHGFCHRLSERV